MKPCQGELSYNGHEVRVFDFLNKMSTRHIGKDDIPKKFGMSGHAAGDYNLIRAFVSAVAVSDPWSFVSYRAFFQVSIHPLILLAHLIVSPCLFLWMQNGDPSHIRSGPEETLMSHLLVFEAERSRLQSRVVYCGETNQKFQ